MSEVDAAHLFLTIIQFHSAIHLISHHTQALALITMLSQSAQKRQRLYTNQHLENLTMNQPSLNGQKLKVVNKFTYLASTLSRAVHIDDEVTARIAKASVAFGRLRTNVWERNGIKLDTKLKFYEVVVLPTLLYACETWTVYQRIAKRLNQWQDKIPDTEDLKKAGMQSMQTVLKLAQLRWTGHVISMPDERLPKKVFYGKLQEGKRS